MGKTATPVGEELDMYIEERKMGAATPLFFGYESFADLLRRGRIDDTCIIRVRDYHRETDPRYAITQDGRLENDRGNFDPKELLSLEKAPDGWESNYIWRPKQYLRKQG
ncbi:MAG: hypothetical protein HY513_04105 [Candidatus Aenigmarchaeota archaeon]|nr:hypothetical protein [Candidatus Aenigmarchaeota archaeon]